MTEWGLRRASSSIPRLPFLPHGLSRSWYLASDMQRRIKKEIRNYETWFYDAKIDAETATDDISYTATEMSYWQIFRYNNFSEHIAQRSCYEKLLKVRFSASGNRFLWTIISEFVKAAVYLIFFPFKQITQGSYKRRNKTYLFISIVSSAWTKVNNARQRISRVSVFGTAMY